MPFYIKNRVYISSFVAGLTFILNSACAQIDKSAAELSIDAMIQNLADDYKKDPMAVSSDFGIKVGDEWWSISVKRRQTEKPHGLIEGATEHIAGPHEVSVKKGKPETSTWYVEFADKSSVDQVYDGVLTVGTASARSFGYEKKPVNTRAMTGFKFNTGEVARMYHTLSHFWEMGIPEIVTFNRDQAMETHGQQYVSLYEMKDKRIGWFSLAKGEAGNLDERLQYGEMPNFFIITRGKGIAHVGDQRLEVEAGMSGMVAPYVRHYVYNPNDEPLEGISILFGDNSDFLHKKSYIDYIEDYYDWLGDYPFKEQ